MAYTPKTWACGDTITAEELNRMEEGISSAQSGGGTSEPLIVEYGEEREVDGTTVQYLNKTYGEIKDAYMSGKAVFFRDISVPDGMTSYDSLSGFGEVVHDGRANGDVDFGSKSFPVAGLAGDVATTLEELLEKYPHVYPE